MHHCLNVDEILRLLACTIVASGAGATAVVLACCCKSCEDPVLDVLWVTQDCLFPLLKSLPGNVWKVEGGQFVSLLTALGSVPPHLIARLGISLSTESRRKWNGVVSENTREECESSKWTPPRT